MTILDSMFLLDSLFHATLRTPRAAIFQDSQPNPGRGTGQQEQYFLGILLLKLSATLHDAADARRTSDLGFQQDNNPL